MPDTQTITDLSKEVIDLKEEVGKLEQKIHDKEIKDKERIKYLRIIIGMVSTIVVCITGFASWVEIPRRIEEAAGNEAEKAARKAAQEAVDQKTKEVLGKEFVNSMKNASAFADAAQSKLAKALTDWDGLRAKPSDLLSRSLATRSFYRRVVTPVAASTLKSFPEEKVYVAGSTKAPPPANDKSPTEEIELPPDAQGRVFHVEMSLRDNVSGIANFHALEAKLSDDGKKVIFIATTDKPDVPDMLHVRITVFYVKPLDSTVTSKSIQKE